MKFFHFLLPSSHEGLLAVKGIDLCIILHLWRSALWQMQWYSSKFCFEMVHRITVHARRITGYLWQSTNTSREGEIATLKQWYHVINIESLWRIVIAMILSIQTSGEFRRQKATARFYKTWHARLANETTCASIACCSNFILIPSTELWQHSTTFYGYWGDKKQTQKTKVMKWNQVLKNLRKEANNKTRSLKLKLEKLKDETKGASANSAVRKI